MQLVNYNKNFDLYFHMDCTGLYAARTIIKDQNSG